MLTLRGVSAGYGSFPALFEVSLEVAIGEAVGVVGPNGAGKTTLMRVISGLLPVSSGSLAFEGRALTRLPAHRIVEAGIAHVPENRRLFARLTVEENLRIGAFIPSARAQFAERRDWVFSLFPRLAERRRQLAGTLSGGEQQMLAIGRALMTNPTLLIMDEPSEGLAPMIVREIGRIVADLKRERLSILLVEQNLPFALALADRVYVMNKGQIVFEGTAAALAAADTVKHQYLGV
jgi:branched-chain amino acid transport system ATP-binding protein